MARVIFHPVGSGDSNLIELDNKKLILFDYGHMRCVDSDDDKRCDLPQNLRKVLDSHKRNNFDVVAFTHLDMDHIKGSSDFFYFEHAKKYQSEERIKIDMLWVPAAAILETSLEGEQGIIRAEAKYRLKEGKGIKVFSRPGALDDWLKTHDLSIEQRKDCFVDAGQLIPEFTLTADGVEFFVHSPFASRTADGTLMDRNKDSIVVQATFVCSGMKTRLLLSSDIDYSVLEQIIDVTDYHKRPERLEWDIYKLPHHCSYTALGSEKGKTITEPTAKIKDFVETKAQPNAIIVSTSDPIPTFSTDGENPPHMQAANYYKQAIKKVNGVFMVTMEQPNKDKPKPLEIIIDENKARIVKEYTAPASTMTSTTAPRVG